MRQFLQLCLGLSLAVLVTACGESSTTGGGGAAASGAAGTYTLDQQQMEAAILELAKANMPMWDKLPEATRAEAMKQVTSQAAQMTMSMDVRDDGTFIVEGKFGDEPMSASGTYAIDGEKITVTTLMHDGKAEETPETVGGTIKDNTITIRPDKDMPFDLVLVRK